MPWRANQPRTLFRISTLRHLLIVVVSVAILDGNPALVMVPHTPADVANWLALGYTSEKVLDAGRQTIEAPR